MTKMMELSEIEWDPKIYPRQKWNSSTIDRYADAMEAGDEFPPLVVERGTNRLLDGKHRLEAHKKTNTDQVEVEVVDVPEDMSAKYYAATFSARHGDRLSNAEIKELAVEEFEKDPDQDVKEWGRRLGVSERTVYRAVSHILERKKKTERTQAWHLTQLGWTQTEIAEVLGVTQPTVGENIKNCHLAKFYKNLGEHWNEKGLAQEAERLNLPLIDCYASVMQDMDDRERMKTLGIKIKPYDVWTFSSCHGLMGDKHPGRIPGELIAHVLYFFTEQGDLVIDPMSGSGTTQDACLLMGRECRGYDIDDRHERVDVISHDLSNGWPERTKKADLIFWDPPYFDKKNDEYIEGSISDLSPDEYLKWFKDRFSELHETVKQGTRFAFLMSDWDSENAKSYQDHPGIFSRQYGNLLNETGWQELRYIQCPLSTQQIHPDIVNKFRKSKRLARLSRTLIVSEAR